jgi:hypothetical protein
VNGRASDRLALALLAGAMAASAALVLWLQRDLVYASDSSAWIQTAGLGNVGDLVEPRQGHLMVLPFAVFKASLELTGIDPLPLRLLGVAAYCAVGGLMWVYARQRVGPLLALAPAVILLFLGSSWNVYLEPMLGLQLTLAIGCGLAALLMLEREDRSGDIGACILLCLALASFSSALAFLAGAAISIALSARRKQRAWIVLVPLLLYGAWRVWALKYGETELEAGNALILPGYFADSVAVVAVSLFGRTALVAPGQWAALDLGGFDFDRLAYGAVYAAFILLAAVLAVRALLRRGPLPRGLWVAAGVLCTLWVAQGLALSPERTPAELRYIYPGTVALLLVAVELANGVRASRLATWTVLALTALAVFANLPRFREGRQLLDGYSREAPAAMTVMLLAGNDADPTFAPAISAPDVMADALFIPVAGMQRISAELGRLELSLPELRDEDPEIRNDADRLAQRMLGLKLEPTAASVDPGRCTTLRPTASEHIVELPQRGAVLVSRAPAPVRLRRFGPDFAVDAGELAASRPARLRIPPDRAPDPWVAQVGSPAPLMVCPLP